MAYQVVSQRTSHGEVRLHINTVDRPKFTLVLHHGAGGGVQSPDLIYIADHCVGGHVVRVEQPWRVAGKRIAPAPRILDDVACEIEYPYADLPLILGGRSAGARVACRTGIALGAQALLLLAFPLHPPRAPGSSRRHELDVELPKVIIQGEQDPFGRPEEFGDLTVLPVAKTGHSLGEVPLANALRILGIGE